LADDIMPEPTATVHTSTVNDNKQG